MACNSYVLLGAMALVILPAGVGRLAPPRQRPVRNAVWGNHASPALSRDWRRMREAASTLISAKT